MDRLISVCFVLSTAVLILGCTCRDNLFSKKEYPRIYSQLKLLGIHKSNNLYLDTIFVKSLNEVPVKNDFSKFNLLTKIEDSNKVLINFRIFILDTLNNEVFNFYVPYPYEVIQNEEYNFYNEVFTFKRKNSIDSVFSFEWDQAGEYIYFKGSNVNLVRIPNGEILSLETAFQEKWHELIELKMSSIKYLIHH